MITNPKPHPAKETNTDRGTGEKKRPVGIPYIYGLSEERRRIFKLHNRDVFYKLFNTLQQILVRPKDKSPTVMWIDV